MKVHRAKAGLVGALMVLGSWQANAQGPELDLQRRVLVLELQLAEVQGVAARATAALEANAAMVQQLAAAKEMAMAAVNGQTEVLRKAQAIVDRASGNRAEIEDLKSRLGTLEGSVAQQATLISTMDRSPTAEAQPIPSRPMSQVGRERIVHLGDARNITAAVPVATEIGPCPALMAGNRDAWQAALNSFGVGLTFESVDMDAQMALIKTSKGNREAIAAGDILSRSGCL